MMYMRTGKKEVQAMCLLLKLNDNPPYIFTILKRKANYKDPF